MTWDGYVGLMYVSDYGYGALAKGCARTNGGYFWDIDCYVKNWLLDTANDQWTFTIWYGDVPAVFVVLWYGYADFLHVGYTYVARPVLSIRATEFFTGTGTITNPFMLQ